jgi:hypothetical protein
VRNVDLAAVTRRTYRLALVLAVAGIIGAGNVGGVPGSIGFALGAAFSVGNFYLWHRTVLRVGEGSSGAGAMYSLRYILLGFTAYAILNYFEANVLAALVGCFVAVAAVILEILFELVIYSKHGT